MGEYEGVLNDVAAAVIRLFFYGVSNKAIYKIIPYNDYLVYLWYKL